MTEEINSENRDILEAKEKNTETKINESYNYNYWREKQREQLSTSSNLYFLLSSAIIGFTLKFLIDKPHFELDCYIKIVLIISLVFNVLSLISYSLNVENRLEDFRETSKLIRSKKTHDEISELTSKLGEKTWKLYGNQKQFLYFGFVMALIGFGFVILN